MIKPPENINLPFFAYGLFKPGELAHHQIQDFVTHQEPFQIIGCLKVMDGIPLFGLDGAENVQGVELSFRNKQSEEAYRIISKFYPEKLFYWKRVTDRDTQQPISNILFRVKPYHDYGEKYSPQSKWNSKDDPIFSKAMAEIKGFVRDFTQIPFEKDREDQHFEWDRLFKIQMAYLLLWSVIERYLSFRYGLTPIISDSKKRERFASESAIFQEELDRVLQREDYLFDSRDPHKPIHLRKGAYINGMNYYYRIRNNLVHRGKSAEIDADRIGGSLYELFNIFNVIFSKTIFV